MLNFSIAYGKTAMGLAKDWKVRVVSQTARFVSSSLHLSKVFITTHCNLLFLTDLRFGYYSVTVLVYLSLVSSMSTSFNSLVSFFSCR
jgi:hypothetical protein